MRWLVATVAETIPETVAAVTLRLDAARLARAPRRPARRRAPHRRRRLLHPTQLLDRVAARRRPPGAHDRAARRRRGVALPDHRARSRRPARATWPRRRLLRLGAATTPARCSSSAAAQVWSRSWRCCGTTGRSTTRAPCTSCTRHGRRGPPLPRRAERADRRAPSRHHHPHPRTAPAEWTGRRDVSTPTLLAEVGWPPPSRLAATCAGRRLRGDRRRHASSASATTRRTSGPSGSDPREADMDRCARRQRRRRSPRRHLHGRDDCRPSRPVRPAATPVDRSTSRLHDGPGIVLRCARCHAAQVRVVRADASAWLDLRGIPCSSSTSPRTGSVARSPEDESVVLAPMWPGKGRMPDLAGATAWLGSAPLTRAELDSNVVLVQFGTFTCINWLRTLPHVRAWADTYGGHGLRVVGVQTPEFEIEHDVDSVRRAVHELHLEYPLAYRQRLRESLGRIREPVLARAVRRRRGGPHPSRALR